MTGKRLSSVLRLIILTLPIVLTACWDNVGIESRGFVISIGVEAAKDIGNGERYSVSVALPNVENLIGTGAGGGELIKSAEAATVAGAINRLDSHSGERLYFGHTKAVILGGSLLEDEKLFREALDALERNRELGKNILVLAAPGGVSGVLGTEIPGEPLVGAYLTDFYKSGESTAAVTFRQDLESLGGRLRHNGEALIPLIATEGGGLRLGGTAVITDFRLAGKLDERQTRSVLWFGGEAGGALITAMLDGGLIPVRVEKSAAKTRFHAENGHIVCTLSIKAEASAEEFDFHGAGLDEKEALRRLERACEEMIAAEISETFALFHGELGMDGFELCGRLRKQNHALYAAYGGGAYRAMSLTPEVDMKITGAGVIR